MSESLFKKEKKHKINFLIKELIKINKIKKSSIIKRITCKKIRKMLLTLLFIV